MPPFEMHSKASRQKVNVTLGGAAPSLTSKKSKAGEVGLLSSSMKKAMGVNMGNALGKKMQSNDLRLRLGGGGGAARQGKVAFQQNEAVEEPEDVGDRWANDMYFKSGQESISAPLRQAVPERAGTASMRAPSYLTTAGKRREAVGSSRIIASADILSKKAGGSVATGEGVGVTAKSAIVRRGRGTFSYQG